MTIRAPVQPLTWKFPPHEREPAIGYAARLAALNGVDFVTLMRDAGISAHEVHSGRASGVRDVALLGGLDGTETEALARHTPYRSTKYTHARVGEETLGWGTILSRSYRFCPHCIAQDLAGAPKDVPMVARPWLRLEWMIEHVRTCRIHAVYLAETTPVAAMKGVFIDFSKAMASEVLPNLDHLRSVTEPAKPNAFEDWVQRRMDGAKDPSNWLDGMPLHAALATCEGLGVEVHEGGSGKVSELGTEEWAAASLEGYRIARDGEVAIERFLDGLVVRNQAAGYVGMKSAYGQVLIILERTLDDPAFQRFRDVVRRHIIENVPLAAGIQVLGEVLEERRLHTMSSAAAASGTTRQTLRAIFARSGIAPALAEPNHPRLTVRVDEFEVRLREFAAGLKIADASAAAGIPQKHLLELVARGLVPALFGSREVSRARHRITRADLDAFMDRLFAGAVPVQAPTSRQITVGRACFAASTNIGDLIELILDGRLSWKGRLLGGRRYTDLLVDADEVTRVLQEAAPPRRSLTKKEIHSEMPGLNRGVATALIQAGHLEVIDEFCPTTRRRLPLVTRDSFEAFRSRYVTATEVAELHRMGPRMVIRLVAASGRKPAFDPSKVLGWIYERPHVDGFPWSDERPKPVRKQPLSQRADEAQCIGPGAAAA